ncbi:MAG: PTS sugar transporter subunit IIA [Puniceicoccales bacterium]|jgi:mannitol/fructose-specific phosphotransferase system IIA component (Ntr-type)|nr:PTS sugar transporter subunit IIA [Puniceicoccales bacterium]
MQHFLAAIEAGRLIVFPDGTRKHDALAALEAALPPPPAGTGSVLAREAECCTELGQGLALPHLRAPGEGEILAAAGWCRAGLDGCSPPDGEPVRLVVMYVVPDSRRDAYLREVAGLLRGVARAGAIDALAAAGGAEAVRALLLSWGRSAA